MNIQRREVIKALAAASTALLPTYAAWGQSTTKVKVGYLHTPGVESQIQVSLQMGSFAKQKLELELVQFTTGLELFQAMVGGSLDMVVSGAVLSNFPARGQGKVFLINNIEYATAQLWASESSGIKTVADLKGKSVSTTTGTTAHVFLDRALRSSNLDPAKDIQIINQRMTEAVTSFISGAVPAIALWVPFDETVRSKMPGARKVIDASAFFPQAAIVGGWAARNDYFDKNRPVIDRVIAAWAEANDVIATKPDAAAEMVQKLAYKDIALADFTNQFKASKYYSNAEWRKLYSDGTVTKWLQQVTDFFATNAKIQSPLTAEQYFDPKPFLSVVKD